MQSSEQLSGLEIAVIGLACQFPGAPTALGYWQNLLQGVCSLKQFSVDELVALGQDRDQVSRAEFIRVHGAIAGYDQFDAGLFGINAREADVLDPQHRLLFKVIGHALEDAGYDPARMQGSIGVFAGCSGNTYYADQFLKNAQIQRALSAHQAKVLNLNDFLSTRASYIFGLTGPAFTVQAACATSLVAVAQAAQSLLSGACDLALAGGASLTLPQHFGYEYQEGMILSPDGACRAFDAEAAGTLKGDGAGMVVLKRLADALADGDHIEAVITGFATNNDGHDKAGYLAPGLSGQRDAILAAQMMAGVEAESIEYVEAHGTATPMGDPIEVAALTQAFQTTTNKRHFCGIGSVKTNIGHLDAAAGVAGLIKAILSVKHGVIPASLNFKTPNPKIDFANSPFYVNDRTQVWPSQNWRRAAVSSFGMGGSNVHVIVEQPPQITPVHSEQAQLLPLSAAAPQAIVDQALLLADRLEQSDLPLASVAATLQQGRRVLKYRGCIAAADKDSAITLLRELRSESIQTSVTNPSVIFLLPGQGAQYVGMAAGLAARYPLFKQHVDFCAHWLQPHLQLDLRDLLWADSRTQTTEQQQHAAEQLQQTAITQPALVVIETGLAKLWQSLGVQPRLVLGHSIGEVAAAQIAGVLSLEDALKLAMMRGRLMQALPSGSMLSVTASEAQLAQWIQAPIELAAVNAPGQSVLAGPTEAIAKLQPILTAMGWSATLLHTSHAFHSAMMQPMLAQFAAVLAGINWLKPSVPMLSSVTGQLLDTTTLHSSQYWLDNARHTVRFSQAAQTLLTQPEWQKQPPILLEVGPGRTLTQLIKKHPNSQDWLPLTSVRHVKDALTDELHWLTTLGGLWKKGLVIDWQLDALTRVSLPGYVYQEKRHWVDVDAPNASAAINHSITNQPTPSTEILSKRDFEHWFYRPSWEQQSIFIAAKSQAGEADQPIWLLVTAAQQAHLQSLWSGYAVHWLTLEKFLQTNSWAEQIQSAMTSNQHASLIVDYLQADASTPGYANSPGYAAFHWRLHFFQALLAQNITITDCNYLLVAEQLAAWSAADKVNPLLALPLGLLRVLTVEYPGLRCRALDIASDSASVSRLLAEAAHLKSAQTKSAPTSRDTLIVWRQQQRWRQTFTQTFLPAATPLPLSAGAPILVTGGLGGMGLALATYLARQYQCRLLLLSRSGGEVPASLQGVTAQMVRADVTDYAAMQQVIAQIEQQWGPIQGVIHAAGIAGGGMTAYLREEDVEAVLSAKVLGAQVLQQLLVDQRPQQKLTFWLMCSSLASCVSLIGRSEYTAANLYLDQLATQLRQERGIAAVSINWDAWSGVGMARDYVGDDWILPEQGAQAMARILAVALTATEPVAQMLVSTRDLHRLYFSEQAFDAQKIQIQPKPIKTQVATDTGANTNPHSASQRTGSLLTPLQQQLKALWQELLGLQEISLDANFFELGGDSVVSLQLVSRAKTLGLALKPQQVFDYPTLRQLASSLGDQPSAPAAVNKPDAASPAAVLTPVQHQLHDLWCELLGTNDISLDANFFELGGDSVVSLQLVSRAKALGLALKPQQVFDYPTLKQLAASIETALVTPAIAAIATPNPVQPTQITPSQSLSQGEPLPQSQPSLDFPPTQQLLMSSAQQRMWFLEQLDPGSALYSLRGALLWMAPLNEANLSAALQHLMQRHEILRSGFTQAQGEPNVFIAQQPALPLTREDVKLTDGSRAAIEADLRQRLAAHQPPLVLSQPPLWRVQLLRYSAEAYGLLLTFHHSIIEDWSMQLLLREWWLAYDALQQGYSLHTILPPLTYQYRDFAAWQLRYRQSAEYQTDLQYWREQLKHLPQLELPLDKVRPAQPSHQGAQVIAHLTEAQLKPLRVFCQTQQVSVFMGLQACVLVLLQRLSGQTDLVMGTPVADRPHPAFENMLGVFVNNLVLKNSIDPTQNFAELVRQVRNTSLAAQTHQMVPFEDLVKALQPARDLSRAPLFQVLITYLNVQVDKPTVDKTAIDKPAAATAHLQAIGGFSGATEYDLSFYFTDHPSDGSLQLKVEYACDLFIAETIQRYVQQLLFLIEQLVMQAQMPLQKVMTLPAAQWQQLSNDFNATAISWPSLTLPQVLQSVAAQSAQSSAVQDGSTTLNYQQLYARVNQWAHWLGQQQLAPESCVGVCMQRQHELVIVLLAIWTAGYAYVPIDPNYPAERIAHVLEDCQAPLLLVDQAQVAHLPALTGRVAVIEQIDLASLPTAPPAIVIQPEQLAYVIYTSGSTGKPKGVQLQHKALHNFILGMQQSLNLQANDRLLAVTTVSFDIHILELFLPLSLGACVYVADAATCLDGHALLQLLRTEKLTVMQATPATWQLLLESGWQKPLPLTVLCGGEALSMTLATRLIPLCTAIWNLYGPTETTVWSSVAPIRSLQPPITVGKPIANTQFYVLDQALLPVPLGALGELYIGGDGLSRGYLHLAQMTAERFLQVNLPQLGLTRLYATGDQARWLLDGRLQVMGRLDSQIKLRGFRIELGEIEFQLNQFAGVQQAVVVVREMAQGTALIAYWISAKPLDVAELRSFLTQRLPHYMVPSYWVAMTEFPKTPNQKIDRKALPQPTQTGVQVLEKQSSAALSPPEQVIAEIFQQVLNIPQVTAYDNFFDLGGHSLLSMKVVEALHQRTGIRMHPGEMFQQTVGQLAAYYGAALLPKTAAASTVLNQSLSATMPPVAAAKPAGWLKRWLG